jgi:hypothetical protein
MAGTRSSAASMGGRFMQTLGRLGRSVEGIAALEFALIGPIMIYVICCGFDIATALLLSRRLSNAADVVGELVSQQTDSSGNPTGNSTAPITNALLLGDFFSVVTTFPNVLPDAGTKGNEPWQYDIQVIASEVEFGPETGAKTCTTPPPLTLITSAPTAPTCNTANVLWSAGFTPHNSSFATTRPCGLNTLTETKSTAAVSSPTLTTMPHYLYQPGDLIVVDVFFVYTPMFTRWITGSFVMERAAYIEPRFFTKLNYTPTGTLTGGLYPDSSTGISSCQFTGAIP